MVVKVKQGENFTPCIKLTHKKTGAPVDLTGCTAYSQMRTAPNGELIATGNCIIDYPNGRITVQYDSQTTNEIPLGNYGYDVWLLPDGDQNAKRPIWTEEVTIIGRYTDEFGA